MSQPSYSIFWSKMVLEKIADKNISVLLQGTLRLDQIGIADKAIRSIRNILPNAEIVLSHPEHEDPRGLVVDKIVSYKDPGPDICFCGKSEMNLSRPIVSMQAGLAAIDRAFVLKFRPEFELTGNRFVNLESFHKIRVTNAFTHNLNRDLRYLHASDVIQFGKYERLHEFWSIKFLEDDIWACAPNRHGAPNVYGNGCSLLRPEQFLTFEYAKKCSGLDFSDLSAVNVSYPLYRKSHSFMTHAFEVVPMTKSQIDGPSRFTVVSERSRYRASWQTKNPNVARWIGSLIFWWTSSEGALISLRAVIRRTIPALEGTLANFLSSTRKVKARFKN